MRVLITGGSSGLGAALARAFSARGDSVLICDLNPPVVGAPSGATSAPEGAGAPSHPFRSFLAPGGPVPSTVAPAPSGSEAAPSAAAPASPADTASPAGDAAPATTAYLHLDVRSEDDWAAALDWVTRNWGGLDVLVNNAGVAGGGRIDVATLEEWEWITQINLFGVVRGTRAFVPMFKAQRSGYIVNTASLAGLVHPAGMGSYNAVKAAVVAFTETTGHELASYGVKASAVCPSYFRTNLVSSMQGADKGLAAIISHLVESSPVSADDIAAAVLAGMERGDEIILPDEAARQAWGLKQSDRAAYDKVMRAQAAKLEALGE
ncbi:MAG: Short-chain dehydrogenase [Marmoricola sp.]|nr:Short-chain dehydrogenase [Marmoricola sp.]